jgi:hypothetical protein
VNRKIPVAHLRHVQDLAFVRRDRDRAVVVFLDLGARHPARRTRHVQRWRRQQHVAGVFDQDLDIAVIVLDNADDLLALLRCDRHGPVRIFFRGRTQGALDRGIERLQVRRDILILVIVELAVRELVAGGEGGG